MTIFLNDRELDATLENEKTLGDVFAALEKDVEDNGATIIEVHADGKNVRSDEFDTLFAASVDSISRLDLYTADSTDIKRMLFSVGQSLAPLGSEMEQIPVLLQTGGDSAAMQTIARFADVISLFYRIMGLVELFEKDFSGTIVGETNIKEFASSFRQPLQEFLGACDRKDTVLMGDIAEYEISPRIRAMTEAFSRFTV